MKLRTTFRLLPMLFVVAGFLAMHWAGSERSQVAAEPPSRKTSQQDVERWISELSNWGRWGKEDQLGTLNLITPEKRRAAVQLVKDGHSVSLAHPTVHEATSDNPNPFEQEMLSTGQDPNAKWGTDRYSVAYHGYAHTHMDALCHLFYKGRMYNGFSQREVTEQGAQKLSIFNVRQGIMTRGILIDIPRLRGVPYLEPGDAIYPEELRAWENRAGIQVRPGDVVFIRTGKWARRADKGPWDVSKHGLAGLHASCGPWLRERDVAMLGSDAASDVIPSRVPGMSHPIHVLALHAMGIHIFDNCDLESLAEECAKRDRWEFLLTASPLPVPGGTGSPLNPIATF